jgi:hypothetical protein
VSNKVTLFAIFGGLSGVALFFQRAPGQTEDYEVKPIVNEVWVRLEPGTL